MAKRPSSFSRFPELTEEAEQRLLENIFDAARVPRSTVPLKNLALYSEYRRERFTSQKHVLTMLLVLFLLVPLCFFSPKIRIEHLPAAAGERLPKYRVSVKAGLPVRFVAASIGETGFAVYEEAPRTYIVQPTVNGEMAVKVSLYNFQYNIATVTVDSVDFTPPALTKTARSNGLIALTLKDDGTGIDWENVTAETASGEVLHPVSVDSETGTAYFALPEGTVNVFVPDLAHNALRLMLTVE